MSLPDCLLVQGEGNVGTNNEGQGNTGDSNKGQGNTGVGNEVSAPS
jgi:hypothetical protein